MPMVDETTPRPGTAPDAPAAVEAAAPGAQTTAEGPFKPKILAFACKWCTYAGADLAGLNRMKYPADIRLLRVPCSGRVNPQYVLEALQRGCDGVIVCGCHPGDCHYASGNYYAKRRMMVFKRLLEYAGLQKDRFQVRWISGAEAGKFRDTMVDFCGAITDMGPLEDVFDLGSTLGAGVLGAPVPAAGKPVEPYLNDEESAQADIPPCDRDEDGIQLPPSEGGAA